MPALVLPGLSLARVRTLHVSLWVLPSPMLPSPMLQLLAVGGPSVATVWCSPPVVFTVARYV